jgi:hypothetical protein
MIKLKFDSKAFMTEMTNIIDYSAGFTQGMNRGKTKLLDNLGSYISEMASEFIDTNARVSPATLHHIYEWTKVGSPNARLFDISYSVKATGLSFTSDFKQSQSIKNGSNVPFYNKARIMEDGISVTISPREAQALVFDVGGETIFTKGEVVIDNPGGNVAGEFKNVFDLFFNQYFSQSFLKTSGLDVYFKNPIAYKINLRKAKTGGRSAGINVGYNWVIGAGVGK